MSEAMLALGAGLQSFGRGWMDLRQQDEDKRRFDAEQARREAEADEMRRWRGEQSQFQRDQQRDLRRSRRRAELQDYWSRQGVVLQPDRLNALIEAEESEQDQAATMATVPTGDEGFLPQGAEAPAGVDPNTGIVPRRRPGDAMAEIARRALEASRGQQGARVSLDDNWGFAQDEQALRAAQALEQARERERAADERASADRAMRETVARIGAANRGGGASASLLNARINDQEQVIGGLTREITAGEKALPQREGLAAVAAMPGIRPSPMMAAADSAFRADSTRAAAPLDSMRARMPREQGRLDALKILRGDSELFSSQGADPLDVPRAERGGVTGIGTRTGPPEQPASVPFTPRGSNVPGAAAISRADAQGPNAPAGTMDAMVAAATGATSPNGASGGARRGNPAEAQLAQQAQQAIARIMALPIPDEEKQARVQRVNERLAAMVRGAR